MSWRRRAENRPPGGSPPSVSDETRRAKAAAREAAIQLDEVRAQRGAIEASSQEIDDLNRHNGFYNLVRNALGAS